MGHILVLLTKMAHLQYSLEDQDKMLKKGKSRINLIQRDHLSLAVRQLLLMVIISLPRTSLKYYKDIVKQLLLIFFFLISNVYNDFLESPGSFITIGCQKIKETAFKIKKKRCKHIIAKTFKYVIEFTSIIL